MSNFFDQFDAPSAAPKKSANFFDQFDDVVDLPPVRAELGDTAPERTWGEALGDTATRVRQELNTVVGGMLGAPVNVLNAASQYGTPLRIADTIARRIEGLPSDLIEQPEAVRGMRYELGIKNALEQDNLSAKALHQAEGFQEADGLLGSLKYLAQNPSYAGTEAAAQLPQLLQLIPGSVLGTIGAQAVGAGSQNAQQVEEDLIAQGIEPAIAAQRAADTFAASTTINAGLPQIVPGGSAIERLLAGQAGRGMVRAGASKTAQVATSALGEIVTEGVQEGGDQAIQNLATGRPITEQLGQNAALGMLFGGPGGLAAGAVDVMRQPRADTRLLGDPPPAGPRGDVAVAPEDTSDLDALLGSLPPEVAQVAASATPEQQQAALSMLGEVLGDQASAEPDEDVRWRRPTPALPVDTAEGPKASPATEAPDSAPVDEPAALRSEDIPNFPGLNDAQRQVETRARESLVADPEAAISRYMALPGTENGRIVSADEGREVFDDYSSSAEGRSKNAVAVHEPASWVAKEVYRRRLAEPVRTGQHARTVFTGGGTGAGKTSGPKRIPAIGQMLDKADIVYDGNLQSAPSAVEKIDRALGSGRDVDIVYTFRDPVQAFVHGVLPRAAKPDYGRTVPVAAHVSTHAGAAEAYLALRRHYAGNDRVNIRAIWNDFDGERSDVRKTSDAEVRALAGLDRGKLTAEVQNALETEHQAGRVQDRVYRGTLGIAAEEGTQPGTTRPDPAGSSGVRPLVQQPAGVADGESRQVTPAAAGGPAQADDGLESTDLLTESAAEASREDGDADADRHGLRAAVNNLLGKEVGDRVIYLRGYAGLPANLRRGVETRNSVLRKGQTAALYDPKTRQVYVFTHGSKDPARAAWNAAHEIAGHDGLRALLGDKLNNALELALQNPTVQALADVIYKQRNFAERAKRGKKTVAELRLESAEEALAELSAAVRTGDFDQINQRYGVPVPEGIRATLARAIDNFLRRLKALFDKQGVVFKDAEVRELLEAAWQAVDGAGEADGPSGMDASVPGVRPIKDGGETAETDEPLESVDDARDRADPITRAREARDHATKELLSLTAQLRDVSTSAVRMREIAARASVLSGEVSASPDYAAELKDARTELVQARQAARQSGETVVIKTLEAAAVEVNEAEDRLRKLKAKAAEASREFDKLDRMESKMTQAERDAAVASLTQLVNDAEAMRDAARAVASKRAERAKNLRTAEEKAEQRREEATKTLQVARGSAGWNYDSGQWEGRKGQANNARAHLQDKMLAWREVQGQIEANLQAVIPDAQNVYRLENLMHGRVSEGIDRIEREQVKPLVEAMRAAKIDPATLEEYLYARHAQERNAQIASINPGMPDGGSGMTNAEAAKILASADKAKLEPLAKRVDAIAKATRRRLLAHGLITQDAFDAMEAQYQHYVPLRGKQVAESEDFGGDGGMAGRGLDSRGKPVRQALGRGAGNRAEHILGEVIGDAERSVILAEKARVGRAVMRIVLANPNPALWQLEPVEIERALDAIGEVYEKVVNDWSDPSVIAVRHQGRLYRVQINSVPLAKALNNVGVDQLGQVTRMAGAVNRFFSAILTKYNFAFTPKNATRDALFGLTGLAVEHGELAALDAAIHYPQAAAAAFQQARGKTLAGDWGQWAEEFTQNGGKTGYVNLPSAEDIARKIGSGSLTSYSPAGLQRAVSVIGDAVGVLNDAVENALRLSAYVTLRKRGMSAEAAAAYAKDLTVNFNRKGFGGSKLNAWFLFYNASIQGGHRFSKLMRKPKTWGYLGALATVQVVATLAAMGMTDDNGEPLWNKVPDHVKQRNIVIVTPDGGLITIPMPYGFNLFPYMAGRIAERVANAGRGDERPTDSAGQLTADFISTATQSFSPVPLDTGPVGLVPNLLRIPVNVWANRNDFGGKIRDEQPYAKSDVPRASMGRPDTLEVFKLGAKGLNRIGGGDDLTPPPLSAFDLAPEDLEYLLKSFTGGPGNLIADIATAGQKATGGDYAQELDARDIPIAKLFRSNIDEQAAQQALFYDRRETVDRSLKRVRQAFKLEGAAAAERLLAATPELKGAAFKRRKGEGRKGEAPGSIIMTDGNPQIIAIDPASVFGTYKAAENAIKDRNDSVETAFSQAPASILPNEKTRQRDASIRTSNRIRQAAQSEFNAAWVRDVVGSAE